jgi:acyl-CoA reductase-like NAD-dependent aldehyde dehydrogenase
MAAGNCCILKPSEIAEHTMKAMSAIINENFPSDYLYVYEGGIEETTALLQFKFDKIFFTGSTKVGKIVYKAAAEHLTPVVLELGGKSPAIVTKDAHRNSCQKNCMGKISQCRTNLRCSRLSISGGKHSGTVSGNGEKVSKRLNMIRIRNNTPESSILEIFSGL